ncbi:hypothetical protein A9239_17010 [Methanosarcina sp. A14]|nr:hypothetical protein A9239_17010 [Methanosarcina sp. A14]
MITISLTLNNFSELPSFFNFLDSFSDDYELPQEKFFVEKLLHLVLFAVLLWFITAIIHTPKKSWKNQDWSIQMLKLW